MQVKRADLSRGASHTCLLPSCHCSGRNSKWKGPGIGDTNCCAANDIPLWSSVDRRERLKEVYPLVAGVKGACFTAGMAPSPEAYAQLRIVFLYLFCPAPTIGKNLGEKFLSVCCSAQHV